MSGQTTIELAQVITALHETAAEQEEELAKLRQLVHDQRNRINELEQLLNDKEVPLERIANRSSNGSGNDGGAHSRGKPLPYHLNEDEP